MARIEIVGKVGYARWATVNLAAFASASGHLVAAVRGVCHPKGLSRSRHALFGMGILAVSMKEHDA
jgi:hypothetical protein